MTKAELTQEISDKTGIDKRTVLTIVESLMTEHKEKRSISVDSAASSSNAAQQKQPGISQRTRPFLYRHMIFRHSNRQKSL